MSSLYLSLGVIRHRCTARSFQRGEAYYELGAISNPIQHGYTLWAECEGNADQTYRVQVALTPTGIADAHCTCPYSGAGDCKHIVALLLTRLRTPDVVTNVEALLEHLGRQPKSHILGVLGEVLQRAPEWVSVARFYSLDVASSYLPAQEAEAKGTPYSPGQSTVSGAQTLEAIYAEQIDTLFGRGFLEDDVLQEVLSKLERIRTHARSLAQRGEHRLALTVLIALIQTCIARYEDTLQGKEIPQFVRECVKTWTAIAELLADTPAERHPGEATWRMAIPALLDSSFEVDAAFTDSLTTALGTIATSVDVDWMDGVIRKRLPESSDIQAHVHLLLNLYERTGRIDDYLSFGREQEEYFLVVTKLLELRRLEEAWDMLWRESLHVEQYWKLLQAHTNRRLRYHSTSVSSTAA